MPVKTIASGTVADAYLTLLADRGIEFLFANAGTDFAPLIESYAKAQAMGTVVPKPVTVPHENVAVGMALGHYLKTGRPQAVMVHVNVGTANAMCGIINAWRGNIPFLMTAGRTPYMESGDVTGMRTTEIHWPQEMRDQRAMVRELVKWDYELPNWEVLETAVDRALNIAMSQPTGPVYMTLPREVMAATIGNFQYNSPSRHMTPTVPYPDVNAIDRAADMIAAAEFPLIICQAIGRQEEDVAKLAALAEGFAIPVTQRKPRYMCLPTDHPMHLGFSSDAFLDKADLIMVIDCDVPWVPSKKVPQADCKVIHIGSDPIFQTYPMRGFTCDLAITGMTGVTLDLLTKALETRLKASATRIDARRKKFAVTREEQRGRWRSALDKAKDASPIHPAWLTHCIDKAKSEDAIVVKESVITFEHIGFSKPGTFYSIGAGGGLGWGLGTALGLKNAARDKLVICTVGDGAYMFGNPIPAHYVGKAERLPTLTVVLNNEMWGAVKRNTREVYPDGYASRSNREPLTYFEPGTHFERAVEAVDGYGEKVEKASDLPAALDRALDAIGGGRQALLNVICRGP